MSAFDYEMQISKRVKVVNKTSGEYYVPKRIHPQIGDVPNKGTQYFTRNGDNYVRVQNLTEFDPRVEYYVQEKKYYTAHEMSKFKKIAENKGYIEEFAKFLYNGSLGEILNNHVFKFTRLREDIIFVKVRLQKIGSQESGRPFYIAVNEKSFWNRFKFYKSGKNISTYSTIDKLDAFDLLLAASRHSSEISSIKIKLLADESIKLNHIIEHTDGELKTELQSYQLEDNANVNIDGFVHYCKRLWIGYLAYNRDIADQLNILNYTDPESKGFYNPNDPQYEEYKLFYN